MGTAGDDSASESANQVDDSRFSNSQLSFWKIGDNGSVITDEDDVHIDNDLRLYVNSRLAMLVSVNGCSSFSSLFLVFITYTSSFSASCRALP